MRVLILGGSGMFGHKLWQHCATRFETYATFRKAPAAALFDPSRSLIGVTADDVEGVRAAVASVKPEAVVNCIGIVKQDPAARDPLRSLMVNAVFPHHLSLICAEAGARLIHLSTDCVFSGGRGRYSESDLADAHDLYGRTKLLGEITGEHCLTVRTSMIGRELTGALGLAEWFFSRAGMRVAGYTRAVFSGFTTVALARIIAHIIEEQPGLHGLYHVASEPIAKYDLLLLLNEAFGCHTEVVADASVVCDRSLDGTRFAAATGFQSPSWQEMIEEMRNDSTPYAQLRGGAGR